MKNVNKDSFKLCSLLSVFLFAILVLVLIPGICLANIPAFPGAEGAGALSAGGRGGTIIEVTNLNDSGPGSLREACLASGARTVIFRVGGTIELKSALRIWSSYITIAGQTAPGDGIQIIGPENKNDLLISYGHDVIIRYLRFRHGYTSDVLIQAGCGISIADGSYNVIIDHCSFQWGMNDLLSIWSRSNPNYNCTFSNNILAEALKAHSTCMVIGGENPEQILDMDIHHNFFANASHRNPLFKGKRCRMTNNIIYNPYWYATGIAGGVTMDIIANEFRKGPNRLDYNRSEIAWRSDYADYESGPAGPPSIYIAHNSGWSFDDPESDNWTMIEECGIWDPSDTALSDSFKRTDPLDPVGFPITVESIDIFADNLLLHVGASQRLNADGTWVDVRDAVDSRIIMDYQDGTGFIPENEDQVGGFPVINGGTPYADSDGDGMSDVWEDANGFDKNDAGDGNGDADGDGYTNVEEFING